LLWRQGFFPAAFLTRQGGEMKITVLIDNTAFGRLAEEWGLSFHIAYGGKNYLLDAGASPAFLQNAAALGIDISQVDYGILSHAHYDHSDGMDAFFAANDISSFYLREGAAENCYSKDIFFYHYAGIAPGILSRHKDRIIYVSRDYKLDENVYLIPHKTPGLEAVGEKARMYVKKEGKMVLDNLSHEQSLVFDTDKGLVVFNSCSHAGADVIVREVRDTFGGREVLAMIGGFHLFKKSPVEVRALAQRLKNAGVKSIYTGHCTGDAAYCILKEELSDIVFSLGSGKVFEL
jgi:7,8-dihydropterin-6-yl-methyl-4-(beta-D-ribofuranosyl)aminobenzene 5'-phosphate synthase